MNYLAIASFIINNNIIWNEYATVNSSEVDINDLEAVIRAFGKTVREMGRPLRVTVIANSLTGAPFFVQDWG